MSDKTKTIQDTLQPYVEKLLQGLEKGADLAVEHIPDIIMQYVIFEATIAWLWIAASLFFLFKTSTWVKKAKKIDPNWDTPLGMFSYLGYVAFIFPFMLNISTAIKATFFPKLFLVSEFIKMF